MEPSYFLRGKYFNTFEEMVEADNEFMNRNPTKEDFDYMFDWLRKDIELNYRMYDMKISNRELLDIVQDSFLSILEKIREKNEV